MTNTMNTIWGAFNFALLAITLSAIGGCATNYGLIPQGDWTESSEYRRVKGDLMFPNLKSDTPKNYRP